MASHTITPLRAASRNMRLFSSPGRSPTRRLVSNSRPKPYQQAPAATPAAPKPAATSTSTTTNTPPPPSYRSTPAPAPASTSYAPRSAPAAPTTPLPEAPRTPWPPPPSGGAAQQNNNNNNQNGHAPALGSNNGNGSNGNGSNGSGELIDWSSSYHGLGTSPFAAQAAATLQQRLDPEDIEVKPDGIIYLPEIKYRRILNAAFGPGGWGLAPRGDLVVQDRMVTREYALVAHGRFVAQARGEQQYFSEDGVSTAAEGCKSNALMRCCKDLGVASELWDPRFIRRFVREHAVQLWVEHVTTKKRKQIWLRRDDEVRYPFKKTA